LSSFISVARRRAPTFFDTRMSGRDVYLVGSVPLANSRAVFEAVSTALGPRIKRIADGETGERSDWITWLD
jgi:hypothetical protein